MHFLVLLSNYAALVGKGLVLLLLCRWGLSPVAQLGTFLLHKSTINVKIKAEVKSMKKILLCLLVLCFALTGCTGGYTEQVNMAQAALKTEWKALYAEYESIWDEDVEDTLTVTNTKVWVIKNTKVEEFKKIDYIIQFTLENNIDYRGYNFVAIYNDDSVRVLGSDPFMLYTSRTGSEDFSSFVDKETDLKKKYNGNVEL